MPDWGTFDELSLNFNEFERPMKKGQIKLKSMMRNWLIWFPHQES